MAQDSRSSSPRPQRRDAARPGFVVGNQSGNATGAALWTTGLVGLVALGNYHGRQFDVRQTQYASQDDCLKDWGTEASCSRAAVAPSPSGNSGPPSSSTYVGPRYYWDPDRGKPVVVEADGSERVAANARVGAAASPSGRTAIVGSYARGGFGGIGRGFSGGRGG